MSTTDSLCALRDLNLDIQANEIFTVIGPANSGKTTFLHALNRLIDLVPGSRLQRRDPPGRRRHPRRHGGRGPAPQGGHRLRPAAAPAPLHLRERGLRPAHAGHPRRRASWTRRWSGACASRTSGRRSRTACARRRMNLSGGQQQRLCMARILAGRPDVLLFDEPTSGLDPISTARIEETMLNLKEKYTIVLVTNNVAQAARVGERTAFFLMGEMVEVSDDQQDVHGAGRQPHQRLHHRQVRLSMSGNSIETRGLEPVLRRFPGPDRHRPAGPRARGDRPDRAQRLRQEHPAARLQPHERPDRRRARQRPGARSTARTSMPPAPTCCACARRWAWSSSAPTPSRCRSSRTSPSAWPCTAWRRAGSTTASWRRRCAACCSGTTSRTGCTTRP